MADYKTFYKGCKFDTIERRLINDFIDGIHVNYKTNEKVVLDKKINSYNVTLLTNANDIISKFATLIIVEHMMRYILGMVLDKTTYNGVQGNIIRLCIAQSGTIKFFKKLRKSLKLYKIGYMDTYKAILSDEEKTLTRYDSNKIIIEDWLKEYGFSPIVDYIERTCEKKFFDYVLDFEKECSIEQNLSQTKDEYYANVGTLFFEHIMNLAQDNGIDIEKSIKAAARVLFKKREERIAIAKENRKAYKKDKKDEKREKLANKDNINIFKIMQREIDFTVFKREDIDFIRYSLEDECIKRNGSLSYVVATTDQTVYYLNKNGNPTKKLSSALLFSSDDTTSIMDFVNKMKEQYPTRYIGVCPIRASM